MLKLTSEKSGQIEFAGGDQEMAFFSDWQSYIRKNPELTIRIRELIRPEFQAFNCTLNFSSDHRIAFSGFASTFLLFFVFQHSVKWQLSAWIKRETHDRGGHLLYVPDSTINIQFHKNRDYQLIMLGYSDKFIRIMLEQQNTALWPGHIFPPAAHYYPRSRISDRKTLELLSMLMLGQYEGGGEGIWQDELARSVLFDFLNAKDSRFQPAHLGAAQLEIFYEERDHLLQIATRVIPFSRMLTLAGIRDRPLFRKRLRQLYGLNIRDYIIETRMERAVDLLKDSDLSIKQIAAMTGYKNPFYFSHVFSHYFGQSPKSFRARSAI
jgi:AraC-like DNA-binding protein